MKRSLIYLLLFLTIFLFTRCSSDDTKQNISQSEWERYAAIKAEAEGFVKEKIRNDYEYVVNDTFVSKKVLYQRYKSLFTKENIKLLQRIEKTFSDPVDIRSIKNLKTFLLRELPIIERYNETELLEEYDSLSAIAIQNDYYHTSDSINSVTEGIASIIKKFLQQESELYREFGFSSIASVLQEQNSYNLNSLEKMSSDFIEQTSSIEEIVNTYQSYSLNKPPSTIDSLIYYFNLSISSSGVSIDSLESLSLNLKNDTNKVIGLSTHHFDIPHNIEIIGSPNLSITGYLYSYAEIGGALSVVFTEEKEFELNYLNDKSVNLLFKLLFQRVFIRSIVSGTYKSIKNSEYETISNYWQNIRFQIQKLSSPNYIYGLGLYLGENNLKKKYKKVMEDALEMLYYDVNPIILHESAYIYYSADLYAAFFEPYFAAYLTEHYGYDFFNNPEAWVFIKDIWKQGNRLTIDDIAKMIGQEDFGAELLIKELKGEVRY